MNQPIAVYNPRNGFSLVELLVVISIFAILAAAAGPNFNNMLSNKALDSATKTLIDSIKKAKKVAQAERTFVDVTLQGNVITLSKLNTTTDEIFTLPGRVSIRDNLRFRFDSVGNVAPFVDFTDTDPGPVTLATTNITLDSTSNGANSTVSLSPIGYVSSL